MVRAIMIVEMMGRPAEHLRAELEKHVGILRDVKDVDVDRIEVSEPKVVPAPEGKQYNPGMEMFTTFAECEFEIPNFARLTQTMFDFMPSSVEIVDASSVSMDASEATDLLNNISGRLHRYDEIAKVLGEKYKQMEAYALKAKELLEGRDAEIARLTEKLGVRGEKLGAGAAKKVKKKAAKKKAKKVSKKKKKVIKKKKK